MWAPRVGLSYDVRGDGRWFLSGGLGWFGGRPPFGWFAQVYGRTGLEDVHIVCEGDAVPAFTTDRAGQPTACVGAAGEPISGPGRALRSVVPLAARVQDIDRQRRAPAGRVVLTTDVVYTRGGASSA